jgi:hypothetical protein
MLLQYIVPLVNPQFLPKVQSRIWLLRNILSLCSPNLASADNNSVMKLRSASLEQ